MMATPPQKMSNMLWSYTNNDGLINLHKGLFNTNLHINNVSSSCMKNYNIKTDISNKHYI